MSKLNISLVILFLYGLVTNAAVIKRAENVEDNAFETTTASIDDVITTIRTEINTIKNNSSDKSDDYNETTEKLGALSRDEEATLLIVDQTLFDSAPSELMKSETNMVQIEKSGKLLLLSTPKIAEKPKQPEENPDESEEMDDTIENITQIPIETMTTGVRNEETTKEILESTTESNDNQIAVNVETFDEKNTSVEKQKTVSPLLEDMTINMEKITKLYPINDTLYENKNESKINVNESFTFTVDNQPQESPNSNHGSIILEGTEADYIIVDSDILEGTYTDADSELHLQPIVQSVEIVPSSLDDTLLINYVQSW